MARDARCLTLLWPQNPRTQQRQGIFAPAHAVEEGEIKAGAWVHVKGVPSPMEVVAVGDPVDWATFPTLRCWRD